MTDAEITFQGKGLLLKIYVITGWTIPEDDFTLLILIDQFQKLIVENYGILNTDEIEYAFRQNTKIKDWGKQMNVQLIRQVLDPYCFERILLSETEAVLKEPKPKQKLYTDEELLNFQREDIENYYQRLRNGRGYISVVPDYFRDVLIKDKLLLWIPEKIDVLRIDAHYESVLEFFKRKSEEGFSSIYKKIKNGE